MNLTLIRDFKCEGWNSIISKLDSNFYTSSYWYSTHQRMGYNQVYPMIIHDKNGIIICAFMAITTLRFGNLPAWLGLKFINRLFFMIPKLRTISFHLQPAFKSDLQDAEKILCVKLITDKLLEIAKLKNYSIYPNCFIFSKNNNIDLTIFDNAIKPELIATTRVNIADYFSRSLKSNSFSRQVHKASRLGMHVTEVEPFEYCKALFGVMFKKRILTAPYFFYHSLKISAPKNVKFIFAKLNGVVIAGSGLLIFNNFLIEFSMFSTPNGKRYGIPGGDFLKNWILEYCKDNDVKYYDLNMIDVTEGSEKTKHINQFKLKLGGDILYGIKIKF